MLPSPPSHLPSLFSEGRRSKPVVGQQLLEPQTYTLRHWFNVVFQFSTVRAVFRRGRVSHIFRPIVLSKTMPKAFLFTNKRYDLYNLNIPRIWRESNNYEEDKHQNEFRFDSCRNRPQSNFCPKSWTRREEIEEDDCRSLDEREWTLVIDEDKPVNLSLKKLDLFNLTQLAEVSLARENVDSSQQSPAESSTSSTETLDTDDTKIKSNGHSHKKHRQRSSSGRKSSCSEANRHVCAECGRGFSTLSNLARHRQTHRSPTDSSAVKKCPNCDKVYVSMPAFSMHLRTHNQGCKCHFCGKGFSRPWLLQGHLRTHTGEKPFKCNVCAKAFADKSNLRAHVQTHSSEKPFTCSRCQKTFALKSYLCKHIESSCMRSNRCAGFSSDGHHSPGKTNSDSEITGMPPSDV